MNPISLSCVSPAGFSAPRFSGLLQFYDKSDFTKPVAAMRTVHEADEQLLNKLVHIIQNGPALKFQNGAFLMPPNPDGKIMHVRLLEDGIEIRLAASIKEDPSPAYGVYHLSHSNTRSNLTQGNIPKLSRVREQLLQRWPQNLKAAAASFLTTTTGMTRDWWVEPLEK